MSELAGSSPLAALFDRRRWLTLADWLAVAVAFSLPWSTSLTSILIILWLLALTPTLRLADAVGEIAQPASGLPVLLCLLGLVGALWSAADIGEQLHAIKGFPKLLVIPFLFIQFRRSDRAHLVLGGFLVSCTALLVTSWILHFWIAQPWRVGLSGVPVKDYIVQSVEFLICAVAVAHLAVEAWGRHRHLLAAGLTVAALLFLANIAFVATGRTSLVAFPVLLVLFGLQRFGLRGTLAIALGGLLFAGLIWFSSPYLRGRALGAIDEIQRYHSSSAETSAGFRLEFWKKSVGFVAEAPVLGHGTGSIPILFGRAGGSESGIGAAITGNPHNQTLEIAIQFGLVGVVVLYAMWIAHALAVSGSGLYAWLGQALVAQTVVGSLFLSYVLDFSTGWLYVFGVGVLGGAVARNHGTIARAARANEPSR